MASNDEPKDDKTTDAETTEGTANDEGLVELTKDTPATPAEPAATAPADDAAPTVVAEAVQGDAAAEPKPAKPVGLLAAVGVLAVLLVGLFVLWNPWFGAFNGSREVDDLDEEKDSASAAACEIANNLFSYDYAKIDDFFDAVQNSSTGRFGSGFVADKEQLRTLFVQSQVVSRAEETECDVTMIGDENARVRMQGTQIVVSSIVSQGQEQSEHVDLYMDLEKTDDGWKVADLTPADPGSLGTTVPGTETVPGTDPVPGIDGQPVPEETAVPEVPNP